MHQKDWINEYKTEFQIRYGGRGALLYEEKRLQLSEFSRFLKTDNTTYFCFVDYGSTDGTKKIVADFVKKNPERAQAVFLSFNQEQVLFQVW